MKIRKHEWLKSTRLIYDDELDFRFRSFQEINTPCAAKIHFHYNGSWETLTAHGTAWMADHCVIWENYRSEIIRKYGVPTFVSVRICNVTKQVL